ncbi:transcriptional regulator [Paramuricea clavata]|uniref:Transcriptional regulator n=1 Tax=Paramuricea clavata TaxID=317549 RepID=A0A6S7HCW2_PARCT|nr:transcriptional regulator [Paramuricea clavata]
MSNISMEALIAIGEHFSGNIPSDDEEFEQKVKAFRENPYFERKEPEKDPIYSKRQQEKPALIEEAFERLKGTPGLPESTGGRWYTDNDLIKAEVEKIKQERNPKIPKKRGRPPKAKTEVEVKVPKKRGRPRKVKVDEEVKVPKKRGRPPKVKVEAKPEKANCG